MIIINIITKKRRVQIDEFVFSLDQRDKDIKIKNTEIQKAIDQGTYHCHYYYYYY
jgi:hypothetical protein